jgi:hypothetical protein
MVSSRALSSSPAEKAEKRSFRRKKSRSESAPAVRQELGDSKRSSDDNLKNNLKKVGRKKFSVNWHKEISFAIQSDRWDQVRSSLSSLQKSLGNASKKRRKSFWKRAIGGQSKDNTAAKNGLLALDAAGRTPLHSALICKMTPHDVLLKLLDCEPLAAQVATDKKRLPLHFAVIGGHHMQVVAGLVDAYPAALSAVDHKGQSPLAYAIELAKRSVDLRQAPTSFWMPVKNGDDLLQKWQDRQTETWAVVYWLLLASATHPETKLDVGEKKPFLVDALLYAAPPSVVVLLISASVMLLSYENRATAFAGSTLYSCIARHYPLSILQSLTSQCPKDVRTVRDETGMGLISAQFISGVFQQSRVGEWKINTAFFKRLQQSIERRKIDLDENEQFVDWWKKIEYLIAFCDDQKVDNKKLLLHCALRNPDVPPSVVRLLLALYPGAIKERDPKSGAPPLHLVTQCADYIPRNYEFQVLNGESSKLIMILEADESARFQEHKNRLPLHYAIDAGKQLTSLEPLLDKASNYSILARREPVSGLFPFQSVAAYRVRSRDEFRWNCIARNKYSHAVWKGLDEKQRSAAIHKVAEADDIGRLSTIFQLLRRKAGNICSREAMSDVASGIVKPLARNVSNHFITWLYTYSNQNYTLNSVSRDAYESALKEARKSQSLERLANPDFMQWWKKMKYLIHLPQQLDAIASMPMEEADEYLLHNALLTGDTPPLVIELILALHPNSLRRRMPDSYLLPLQIACRTKSYVSRPFEDVGTSTVELLVKAYPNAARCKCQNGLPLHIYIRSGKAFSKEIQCIVDAEPRALKVRDVETHLFPFQLLAAAIQYKEQSFPSTDFDITMDWLDLPTRARAERLRLLKREEDLLALTAIFELLRRDASVLTNVSTSSSLAEPGAIPRTDLVATCNIRVNGSDDSEDGTSNDEDGSSSDKYSMDANSNDEMSNNPCGSLPPKQPTALMRLLSRKPKQNHVVEDGDVFECDNSVFSGIDVMQLTSRSIHSQAHRLKHPPRKNPVTYDDEQSIALTEIMRNEESFPEPGEKGYIGESRATERSQHDDGDARSSVKVPSESSSSVEFGESTKAFEESGTEWASLAEDSSMDVDEAEADEVETDYDSDFEELIYFQMRRHRKHRDGVPPENDKPDNMNHVKLTKSGDNGRAAPARSRSAPMSRRQLRQDSLTGLLLAPKITKQPSTLAKEQEASSSSDELALQPRNSNSTSFLAQKFNSTDTSYLSISVDEHRLSRSMDLLWTDSGTIAEESKELSVYEQALMLRQHNTSKEFNVNQEELLGQSYANLRLAGTKRSGRRSADGSVTYMHKSSVSSVDSAAKGPSEVTPTSASELPTTWASATKAPAATTTKDLLASFQSEKCYPRLLDPKNSYSDDEESGTGVTFLNESPLSDKKCGVSQAMPDSTPSRVFSIYPPEIIESMMQERSSSTSETASSRGAVTELPELSACSSRVSDLRLAEPSATGSDSNKTLDPLNKTDHSVKSFFSEGSSLHLQIVVPSPMSIVTQNKDFVAHGVKTIEAPVLVVSSVTDPLARANNPAQTEASLSQSISMSKCVKRNVALQSVTGNATTNGAEDPEMLGNLHIDRVFRSQVVACDEAALPSFNLLEVKHIAPLNQAPITTTLPTHLSVAPISPISYNKASMSGQKGDEHSVSPARQPKPSQYACKSRHFFDKEAFRWILQDDSLLLHSDVEETASSPRMPLSGKQRKEQNCAPREYVTEKFISNYSTGSSITPKLEVLLEDEKLEDIFHLASDMNERETSPLPLTRSSHQKISLVTARNVKPLSAIGFAEDLKKSSALWLKKRISTDNGLVCLTCCQNRREVLMLPCRHLCICLSCSAIPNEQVYCPLCRECVSGCQTLLF